jgi:uncharacterized protein YjbI with pentapeptide repeats
MLTDRQVGQAIEDGVDLILANYRAKTWPPRSDQPNFNLGAQSLMVYTLLHCGQSLRDERLAPTHPLMRQLLDQISNAPVDRQPESGDPWAGVETYARAHRVLALVLGGRAADRATIESDVGWLLRTTKNGAHGYDNRPMPPERVWWDNSNTQVANLAVWSAAEAGLNVPLAYWQKVEQHWTKCQLPSGQWSYSQAIPLKYPPSPSMNGAGVASLFIAHDYLVSPRFGSDVGRQALSPALEKALQTFEKGDAALDPFNADPTAAVRYTGYGAFALERAGLASGFKYFGQVDWYRTFALKALQTRWPDDQWGQPKPDFADTCYMLLFLVRGRHPVMFNKLRFDGFWANRPRDLAMLSRFCSKELERPINWQVVPIDSDAAGWLDAPVLYLASHQPPKLTDQHKQKLRDYMAAGGLLFTHADGGAAAFNQWVAQLAAELLPQYPLQNLPADHQALSLVFKVNPAPPLQGARNASRLLWVHSPTDLAQYWQRGPDPSRRPSFEVGVNLFVYAAGKTEWRNRLDVAAAATDVLPTCALPLARLQYAGNWDPEPAAWERFGQALLQQTGYQVEISTIDFAQLDATAPLVHLTGDAAPKISWDQIDALRRYMQNSGVLLIDACGGSPLFAAAVEKDILGRAFPGQALVPLPDDHPLLAGDADGMQRLSKPRLRPHVQRFGQVAPRLKLLRAGRGMVIYSPLDLTTALLDTQTSGIVGYDPSYARAFARNLLIWAADQTRSYKVFPTAADPATLPAAAPAMGGPRPRREGAQLENADLKFHDFKAARLTRANFQGADLRQANLAGTRLRRGQFEKANLGGANLSNIEAELADFGLADLSKANLRNAQLWMARLHGANLSLANLENCDLEDAYLQGANLSGAVLSGARLRGAQLDGANLEGADLRKVQDLTPAQLKTARTNAATQLPPTTPSVR